VLAEEVEWNVASPAMSVVLERAEGEARALTQVPRSVGERAETTDVRFWLLVAATANGVYLVFVTELLSVVGRLSSLYIAMAWVVPGAIVLWLAPRLLRRRIPRPSWPIATVLVGLALLLAMVLTTGLASAPNNYDSMTYHLPRVMHWLQSQSVEHYYTPISRQLYQPPFAEYAIAHIIALTRTDRFAFVVQWFALIGSAVGVSVIARQLGAGALGQVLAATIFVTAPMAILQGSSTQNDLVVTFWIVVTVVAVLDSARNRWLRCLLAGGAVGLALLTKGTAGILLAPFVIWLAVDMLRRHRRAAIPPLAAAALIVVSLNAPHAYRNIETFGNPTGNEQYELVNDEFGFGVLVSNASRNAALEVPGSAVESTVRRLHDLVGLDADDPQITIARYQFELDFNLLEDSAPNPLQILLAVVAALTGAWIRNRRLAGYLLAVWIAFLLFSEIFTWQPWHSRLLLPLIALVAAWTASVLRKTERRWFVPLAFVLIGLGLATALLNESRPLVGRDSVVTTGPIGDVFGRSRSDIGESYLAAAEQLKGCRRVAIELSGDFSGEYSMWTLLPAGVFGNTKLVVVPKTRAQPCSAVIEPWGVVASPKLSAPATG
jgi:4-amino-4-deoxy-L-arabinose transferase-like glycosyltransferase